MYFSSLRSLFVVTCSVFSLLGVNLFSFRVALPYITLHVMVIEVRLGDVTAMFRR